MISSFTRSRTLLLASILGVLCLAVAFGVFWWTRAVIPEAPTADLSGTDPAVRTAVEEARRAVQQSPSLAAAWGKLGQVLLAHNFTKEARVCFAQAERLDPQEVRWPYYQAYILSQESPTEALVKWRRAVDLGADRFPAVRIRLGAALLEVGQTAEAETELRRALEAAPNDPQALLLLGRAEYAKGEFQESVAHLELAGKSASTRKGALTAFAAAQRRLDDAATAEKEIQIAADLPDDAPPPDPLMQEVGELQKGKQAILKRAEDDLKAGRVPEAVHWFEVLVRDYPDVDWTWLRLGGALLLKGDNAAAEKAFRASLERTPDLVEGHFYLGVALYQRGYNREAMASFRRAIELKPDHVLAQYALGECLFKEGDLAGARLAFQAAIESKPGFSDAHAELAVVDARAGQNEEAAEQARQTLQLDPINEKAKQVLEGLTKH